MCALPTKLQNLHACESMEIPLQKKEKNTLLYPVGLFL